MTEELKTKLEKLDTEYSQKIAACADSAALQDLQVAVLGRKGALTELLKNLKDMPLEDKKIFGPLSNDLKNKLTAAFEARQSALETAQINAELSKTDMDLTLPARTFDKGRRHPLSVAQKRMTDILARMGFVWADGPFIEDEEHNFDLLNIPKNHPARDVQDTFFIKNTQKQDFVLRTHTSGVQVRTMKKQNPPIRIIAPGRVYRSDSIDATHSPVFHQIEGLYVDKNISLADLKRDLTVFMQGLFGKGAQVRFRPSFFPFTEPSVEVDVSCVFCAGQNAACGVCKGTGWKEMLGAGIVHPNVLRNCGIDPEEYSGYAFGMGMERLAMFSLNIKDIRAFYENDARVLEQF
ncbi:MAG: phenylalanine--tRNA ligase subunit alpha [Elusimicrobiota bacterium]|jgi:phenylalanyl-tRNA synthetase alpha chain|nr:phenylalanine--tRNA ligase subunit alpha [Elusimicrobiota bacterium]